MKTEYILRPKHLKENTLYRVYTRSVFMLTNKDFSNPTIDNLIRAEKNELVLYLGVLKMSEKLLHLKLLFKDKLCIRVIGPNDLTYFLELDF